jgi:hypothetical protein
MPTSCERSACLPVKYCLRFKAESSSNRLVGVKSRYLDDEMSSWSGSGGESVAGEDGRGEEESYDTAGALQLHLQVYKGAYTVSAPGYAAPTILATQRAGTRAAANKIKKTKQSKAKQRLAFMRATCDD